MNGNNFIVFRDSYFLRNIMKSRDIVSIWIFNFVSTILSGKLTGNIC